MKHGREDYNQIQDPGGKIGEDEPVFILRAKDMFSVETVIHWANKAYRVGEDTGNSALLEMSLAAQEQAVAMGEWQNQNGCNIPDL